MKTKPALPLLISMSAPMILSMLVNSLYNIVDSIFVARIGEDALAALALVYPVQNLITSVAVGFGVGINALIALQLGAGETRRASAAATQGVVLNGLHGILLTAAGVPLLPLFLSLFAPGENVMALGVRYGTIVLCFSVVPTLSIAMEKIFQAVGRMVVTMAALSTGFVINILLDPLMIFGLGPFPKMGIEGAAWATVIGQCAALAVYIVVYLARPLSVRLDFRLWKPEKRIFLRLYAVGIPASLNMALPSVLISVLNSILSVFGPVYVVVLGIYYKLQSFLYLPANGIVQGMRPLISYNYGAGEHRRVHSIYRWALVLIGSIMALGTAVCLIAPGVLMGMFTDSAETLAAGTEAIRILSAGLLVSTVSVTAAGALEALGKGVQSLIISLLRYAVLILPLAFLFSRAFGAVGVWNAFWLAEALTAFAAYFIYRRAGTKAQ
jgi:putative MATE family efflux protein